jgi:hypothetical protein
MLGQKRIRDYGITIGDCKTGPRNAITDVPGVQVGHCTLSDHRPHHHRPQRSHPALARRFHRQDKSLAPPGTRLLPSSIPSQTTRGHARAHHSSDAPKTHFQSPRRARSQSPSPDGTPPTAH